MGRKKELKIIISCKWKKWAAAGRFLALLLIIIFKKKTFWKQDKTKFEFYFWDMNCILILFPHRILTRETCHYVQSVPRILDLALWL